MDMTIIDTVPANTLAEGDTVRYNGDLEDFNTGSLEEIIKVHDDGFDVTLVLEDSGETPVHPDLMVDLYGYTDDTEE
jgi:hypothetical protein